MKVSRGRLGQYKILKSEEKLAKHLPEMELFSKWTLFDFLERYSTVAIKPAFGPGEICVSSKNNTFQVTTNQNITTVKEKEDLYHHLIRNEMKQNFNIIQPKLNSPYQYYITLHRSSTLNEWTIKFVTEKFQSDLGKVYYMRTFQAITIPAAQKIGGFFQNCNTIVIEVILLDGEIWIQDVVLHFPISKWSQYQELLGFYQNIPATGLLTEFTLKNYLAIYNEVIIKPCIGQQGLGIVQITKKDSGTYEVHTETIGIRKSNFDETYHYINENFLSRKDYIVQQKLPLASIDGCPIDVRVITQKYNSEWIVTGKLVKVAARNFIITNVAQKLLTFEAAINDLNIPYPTIQLEQKINNICISAARQLENNIVGIDIIGFDIGFTSQGHIWIIEGNYKPDISMFNRLKDKTIYKNILMVKRG